MDIETIGGIGNQLFVDYDPESYRSVHVDSSEITDHPMQSLRGIVIDIDKRNHDYSEVKGIKDLLPIPYNAKNLTNNNVYVKQQLELDESFEQKMNEVYEGMIKQKKKSVQFHCTEKILNRSNFYLVNSQQSPIARSSPIRVKVGSEQTEPQVCLSNNQNCKNKNLNTFIVTKLVNSKKKCSVLATGSYIWKGFGGLQKNRGSLISNLSHFESKMGRNFRISTPKIRTKKQVSLSERPVNFTTSFNHYQQSNVCKTKSCAPVIPNIKGPKLRSQYEEIKYFLPLASKGLVHARRMPVYDPSVVLKKKSEELQKKSEVEKERRMELAKHRENLRRLVPSTKYRKVTSLAVLDAAREYCLEIQNQCSELMAEKLEQERKRESLLWTFTKLKFQLNLKCVLQDKIIKIQKQSQEVEGVKLFEMHKKMMLSLKLSKL